MPAFLLAAANLLPLLAKYIGNGDATERIANAVSDVAKTIAGVPDSSEALKQIEADPTKLNEFKLAVMAKTTEWDDIFLKDRQDARARDVELARIGFRNKRGNWLAGYACVLVIAVLFVVIFVSNLDEWVKGVLFLILGRALGWVEQLFSFEFGTTKQSAAKDQTIQELSKSK